MKKIISKINIQKGFTLVETMIAVLILSISVSAMLNLVGGSFISVRYSRNDIVANNLLQEAVEYIRNSRDTASLGGSMTSWITNVVDACTGTNGCKIDPYNQSALLSQKFVPCSSACEPMYFFDGGANSTSFYAYNNSSYNLTFINSRQTTYVRTMKSRNVGGQYIIDIDLKWKNGVIDKTLMQSVILTPWNI